MKIFSVLVVGCLVGTLISSSSYALGKKRSQTAPSVEALECKLISAKQDKEKGLVIELKLSHPVEVQGSQPVTTADGLRGRLTLSKNGFKLIDNRDVSCGRDVPAYSSQLNCAWPSASGKEAGWFKVVPKVDAKKVYTGGYTGNLFDADAGANGIDTSNYSETVGAADSLTCTAQ